ncbi:MAG: amidohydrolase family protein [Betaproteobacteria bacterium]|nr:amidohydrolase family protein [Betaproteobacteria bacterium]
MPQILFRNARLLDPSRPELLDGFEVLVEDATIREVSDRPIAANDSKANPVQVIDLKGRTLMPGLIDCHVHALAAHYNLGLNANQPNIFAALRAVPILEGMLKRGFTTIRDAGGADWSLAQATATGVIKGPRIFSSGRALSQTGGHGDFRPRSDVIEPCACSFRVGALARVVDGVDACRLAVREEIQKGANQIKIMASGGVASPNDPIHYLGYSEDEIRAIVEEAGNADTYVMAHAYTARAISRAVRCGVRSIEHGNLVDAEAARMMAEHRAYAVPTLVTYEALATEGAKLGLPPESVAKIEAARRGGLASLAIFKAAGVKMAFGTDLLGESHRLQCEEFRIRADVLGNLAAIQSATLVAAEVVRMEGRLGVIAPGALADLLVLDGDPLRDISVLANDGKHLAAVMQNGRFAVNRLAA